MKVGNVMLFLCLAAAAQGQPQCMKELKFCFSFLSYNSSQQQPPDSCCQPLDYIVKALPQCFCNLLNGNRVEPSIDVSRAQTLPGRCGQRIDPLQCITGGGANDNPTPSSANSKFCFWDSIFLFITVAAASSTILYYSLINYR